MNRFKWRQDKERAERWQRFLKDEGFQAALDEIEQDYIKDWRNALTQRGRERAWHGLKALERVRGKIHAVMTAGKIAEHKLKD